MGLRGVISNLRSLGAKLRLVVTDFAQGASSSSSPAVDGQQIEAELTRLMNTLEAINAMLYDAETREIIDSSVKLWLKNLRQVAYDAEDVLDEHHYEVLREQVEARNASQPDSRKRKQLTLPNGMYDKIKTINDKLAEIEEHRIKYRLSDDDGRRRCNSEMQIAPTSHFVIESDVFGREKEKAKLVDILCSECHDGEAITVVAIVGIGGLGKTTLAQLAYNNQRIKERFDKYGWICVSEDFNVPRLTRESIESITGSSCDMTNLSALQNKISEEIRGKRVLLVLDDVWNENRSHWELFRRPLMLAKQIVILVTTRNESVAGIMQTIATFKLGYMSKEQCWQLFQRYAFGDQNEINQTEDLTFVEIGKQIVEKCGRLPLAIKSIASLLRHEAQEEGWRDVLENELWKCDADKAIFPALEISYARLPTYLKPCFLYCSVFPKDYTFKVTELVSLWASQGYIESNGKKSTKKIGQEYAEQLRQRSFLEDNNPQWKDFENCKFKLHDIVHDLARSKSENRCYSIQMGQEPDSSQKPYHLYVAGRVEQLNSLHSISFDALRTLIFMVNYYEEGDVYDLDISEAHKLRALILNTNRSSKLPKYLCSLYLLRKLTLKYCDFEEFPESIGNLVSLEEFIIEECRFFVEFPKSIGNLVSLKEFEISHCRSLVEFPKSIGNLFSLKEFKIMQCQSLVEFPKSIGNLVSLKEFKINQCRSLVEFPKSIGNLVSLKEFKINQCRSLLCLPTEMGSLTNIQTLEISETKVSSLPNSLNKIKGKIRVNLDCRSIGWLKDFVDIKGTLVINGLRDIVSLADAQCANLVSLHNLECFWLSWDDYRPYDNRIKRPEEGNLLELVVSGRRKRSDLSLDDKDSDVGGDSIDKGFDYSLMGKLQPHPNLRELYIYGYPCVTFPDWIENPIRYAALERIVIKDCQKLASFSFGSLCKLKYLEIIGCHGLQLLKADSLPLQLQELSFDGCSGLEFIELDSLLQLQVLEISCFFALIAMTGIQKLKFLVKLHIYDCRDLQLLGDSLPLQLQELDISWCNELRLALSGLNNPTSLKSLRIRNCSKLQAPTEEPQPIESCKIEISDCPGMKDWCIHHNIPYEVHFYHFL